MTSFEQVNWGSVSPTITAVFAYEKKRVGADMQYRVQITINPVSGIRYFGYPIYAQVSLDGLLKDSSTLKNASPSQWTSAITYTTPWLTAVSKTTGSTTLLIKLYSGMGSDRTGSYTYSLPVDPAASVVSVENGTMGSAITISLLRYDAGFTHIIKYSFGAASGTIATGVQANSYPWHIPIELANQIPSATSGVGTITLETYSGNTLVGSSSASFTATVPDTVTPKISKLTISDATSGIAAQFSAYVQSKSKLKVETTAEGIYGSTISSIAVTFENTKYNGASITTAAIKGSGSIDVNVTVTDSRGRAATISQTITVLAYSRPNVSSLIAYRATSDGTAKDDGTYLSYSIKYTIAPGGNHNTAKCQLQYKKTGDTNWANLATYTAYSANISAISSSGILDVDYSYQVRVVLADYFESITWNLPEDIPTSKTIMDILADGTGVAFGKAAETSGVEIANDWPFKMHGFPVADYIVETGTSGIWTYEKRASGVAKCWCRDKCTSGIWPNYSAPIYYHAQKVTALPEGLFIENPLSFVNVQSASGAVVWNCLSATSPSAVSNYFVRLLGGNNSVDIYYAIEVIGNWK